MGMNAMLLEARQEIAALKAAMQDNARLAVVTHVERLVESIMSAPVPEYGYQHNLQMRQVIVNVMNRSIEPLTNTAPWILYKDKPPVDGRYRVRAQGSVHSWQHQVKGGEVYDLQGEKVLNFGCEWQRIDS
ncbi:hypothetical protein JYB88_07700 [Shewanella cyperi]|uniref:Uncharacterized protein n=1 Tax=Shewanella cyperi TaxID=2814292 RepID=A0A974XN88_9GAMM|nr:hypothetical protein [Shewanella cyperi]QSX31489.1 hypothetical protein JYB88_07700 [Shewanella cyperi]